MREHCLISGLKAFINGTDKRYISSNVEDQTAKQGAKSGGEALLGAARHAMFAVEKQFRADIIPNPLTASSI